MRGLGFCFWFTAGLTSLVLVCSMGCGSGPSHLSPPQTTLTASNHPLVAEYGVTELGAASVWVEFGPDTTYGRQTAAVPIETTSLNKVSILVAGMKASTTYHMRAHVDYADGASWVDQDHAFKTGVLPSGNQLTFAVTRPTSGVPQDGVELIDVISAGTSNLGASVVDRDGNIIWYCDLGPTGWAFPIKFMSNGHVLLNSSNGSPAGGSNELMEIDLAGNIIRELSLTSLNQKLQSAGFSITLAGLHHDVLVLPNGHWILLGDFTKTYTDLPGYPGDTPVLGDVLVDLDTNWNPVWVWSSFDHLDINRHPLAFPDWTHSNAILYTPNDGNLLLSLRDQDWVIKIDYATGAGTGDVLWRLGTGGDFSLSSGDPAQWFYGQHFPYIVGIDGSQLTLAVFDDGDGRPDSSGVGCAGSTFACYSRAVVIQADETTKAATVQWQYLPGYYTFWGGSIEVLDNSDVEFDASEPFGATVESRVMEVTQTDTPEIVWQMDILGGFAYRAYRIPSLYPGVVWQ
jgi:arylsulfate sulfotransferase